MKKTLLALGALTLLWALFFWRVLLPDDRLIFTEGDFTVQFFANADYQIERIHRGEIPLWNPYNYAGEPFAANLQLAAWYPPRWIAALLLRGDWDIYDFQLEVMAHYWLASVMTYAFLRLLLKLSLAALAGAVIFTYGGYLTAYPMLQVSILESTVWLPLMLIGAHLSIDRWPVCGAMLFGAAVGLSFTAGHPQTTMQAVYVALAYFAFAGYRARMGWWAVGWRMALALLAGGGLSMIQLLPSVEFTLLSARLDQYGYLDKSNGLPFDQLTHILWPSQDGSWLPLYVGVAGLLLALARLIRAGPPQIFWGAVALVGLGISLGRNSIVYDVFYLVLPGVSVFRLQEHMVFIVSFALAVLAADQIANGDRRTVQIMATGFFAVHLLLLAVGSPVAATGVLVFVIVMAGLLTTFTHAPALILLILVVDLFTVNTRSNNFVLDSPENRVQPPVMLDQLQVTDGNIQWRVDGSAGVQSYGLYWRIPDIYGIGPIPLDSTYQLRQIPVERFWEVLSVRYVTLAEPAPTDVPLELLAYGPDYELFEMIDPRPMAHLVYDAIVAEANPDFARQFMADPRVDLRETAILLEPAPVELPGERPGLSTVEGFRLDSAERMSMTVSTGTPALLTVSMPLYPGWRVSVDGDPVDLVDTYAGLMGIPLEAGVDQHVEIVFVPDSVIVGAVVSGLTVILMIGTVVFSLRKPRPSPLPLQHE